MTQEKSLGERLEEAEQLGLAQGEAEQAAKLEYLLQEARARLSFKAMNESGGKRWSSRDIDSQVIIEQADAESDLGKAWIDYNTKRSAHAKTKVTIRALSRKSWEDRA